VPVLAESIKSHVADEEASARTSMCHSPIRQRQPTAEEGSVYDRLFKDAELKRARHEQRVRD
jgi:hypothetical protein